VTEFCILGPLEVRRDGGELELGGRKQRAVLALLLLHANQVVSIERLAEDLYGGDTPATAVTQVHRQVSELRRALGDDGRLVETRPPGYLIRLAPGALDLHLFETLTARAVAAKDAGDAAEAAQAVGEALGIWRGPPLADLAYESFTQGAIARLDELRLAAIETQIEAELALGRHANAIGSLRELVSEHPLREHLRELLMVALYRAGRQVEALDLYRTTRLELVDTFGVEPGPRLQELEQAILRQEPDLTPPPARGHGEVPGSVLLAAPDPSGLAPQLAVADPLAAQPPRELVVALLLESEAQLAEATSALASVEARTAAFVSSRGADDVLHLASSNNASLLLLAANPELARAETLTAEVVDVLERSPADVALLFAPAASPPAGGGVFVPFVGGEHDWAAVELGAWLAAASDERLRLAGARADQRSEGPDASRLLADASLAVQRLVGVTAEPALVDPGASGLLEAAAGASAVVVGLSEHWRRDGLGEARRALASELACPVLVVHRGLSPSGIAPRESATRFTWTIAGG
jgi:DNA-binding SARP family transcriptional activator